MKFYAKLIIFTLLLSAISLVAYATTTEFEAAHFTSSPWGLTLLMLFVFAYMLVIFEDKIGLRKSVPVLACAGLMWLIIALLFRDQTEQHLVATALEHHFLEYAELFFFLLVAMLYINSLANRGVFNALRDYLAHRGLRYRSLFWLTGILTFLISPIADNLTTVLVMCAVLLAVGRQRPEFIGISCINIVIAANAGGAFSPFGDITTLMVWQKGWLDFIDFFQLFIPALVNFLLPATFMSFAIPKGSPIEHPHPGSALKPGGIIILLLFLITIVTAVTFNTLLDLPAVFGMLMGLAYLNIYSHLLHRQQRHQRLDKSQRFDMLSQLARIDWDTLLFFYGVIISVGALGFAGYLALASQALYGDLGPTSANVLIGLMSSIVDNIPVMFAVLTMHPPMDQSQWLLITLTTGVGGSLLSIGSAAGIAMMGQARGYYNFFHHLKWSPVIALGYAASIVTHLWLQNAAIFA